MRRPAALFPIALALGAMMLAPWAGVQAQDAREGPIEIEKCQTISHPGSYKLVNNLTFTGIGECLKIITDFVTIDLGGFTISGSGTAGVSVGISSTETGRLRGIAVRNGSISNVFSGVTLSNADGSIIEGLHVVGTTGADNVFGIVANGIVKGNTVVNFEEGFSVTGTVTGNYAALNSDTGFTIGPGSTVIGNTATGGSRFGFFVSCPANLTDNTAVNNGGQNLMLNGNGCNNTNNVAP
jgi:hypothetical protein